MGQAKQRKAEIDALKNQPPVVDLDKPVALYHYEDLMISEAPAAFHTPEGIMAYGTAIVNLCVIPRGQDLPSDAWMTGYGMSYMAKVMTGTPRANERLSNAFLDGDKSGDMLQISWTQVGPSDSSTEARIIKCAVMSLEPALRQRWANRALLTESGRAPVQLGFAVA